MGLRTALGLKRKEKFRTNEEYWDARKNAVYLQHVFALASYFGRDARTILDVGSRGCPYLEWFSWVPRKVSVDLVTPYRSATVESHVSDFLSFEINEPFDLLLCLQTIEHVPDAERFSRKLLSSSWRAIISVPYQWAPGTAKNHIHDPVDEEKIARWFGRRPDFSMISTERGGLRRLVCVFEQPRPV